MKASGYDRHPDDFYQEDRRCVEDLLAVEKFTGLVWDPFAGEGNIPKAIIAAGGQAFGTDIADRGYGMPGVDFFQTDMKVPSICSNPAFGDMQAVIDKALASTTDKVVVLTRLAFLEGQARKAWFKTLPLARVLVSSRRLSMPPGGLGIKATGGTIAFAWLTFLHGHSGPPTIDWV